MKKIFLFVSLLIGTLTFVACTEDDQEWAEPQRYDQEEDISALSANVLRITEGVQVNPNPLEEELVDLLAVKEIVNAPEGTTLQYTNLLLDGVEIPFVSEEGTLSINPNQLNEVVAQVLKSRKYTERQLTLQAKAIALTPDGQALPVELVIDDENDTFEIMFTTAELPAISEEQAFYYVGGANGWQLDESKPFTDNGDGTYSLVLEIGDNEWFCFAPQSAIDNNDWNMLFRAPTNGCTDASGFFNLDSNNSNSFCCEVGGKYIFTISPKDWTYSYAPYTDYLWYSGDGNGWSFSPLSKAGDNFEGYYYIYKPDYSSYWGFKFETIDNWEDPKRVEYGSGGDAYTIAVGGGNIELPDGYDTGFYKISVNTNDLSFSLVPIRVISIVGSAVNNWESTDYPLAYDTEDRCWKGTYTLDAGEFKFRANDSWDINWGGSPDALTQGGANLSTTGGNFSFKLYPMCDGKGYVVIESADNN